MTEDQSPLRNGDVFGRLTVLSPAGRIGSEKRFAYNCRCECGSDVTVLKKSLKSGATKSCGCLHKEILSACKRTHGMSRTRTYVIWCGMISRCTIKNHPRSEYYSKKGVSVDVKWLSFEGFLEDMGIAPDDLSLDRIDNNGDYTKANCRWATQSEQVANQCQKKTNTSGRTGVSYNTKRSKWEAYISINKVRISAGMFESFDDAVGAREKLEIKYLGSIRKQEYEVSRKECE